MKSSAQRVAWPRRSLALATSLFVASVLASSTSRAQPDDVTVVMVASTDSPTAGEEFQVQVEARQTSNLPGVLEEPTFPTFRVTSTTGVRHMQSFRQVMGQPPEIEIRTVVGYSLLATEPGTYTIPAASYRVGRRTYQSAPLIVKVGGNVVPGGPVGSVPSATAAAAGTYDPYVFLRATVDRSDPYVGQQVTYTLYLYTRVSGPVSMQRQPGTTDFWVQDLLEPRRQPAPELQVVQGQRFEVHVLRRIALFPTHAGSLQIGGAAIEVDASNAFDMFQNNRQVYARESPAIAIQARPLPAGAPSGTIVGRAIVNASLDRPSTRTGQALALTVVVRGDGLLRDAALTPPPIAGVRFEAPTVEDRVDSPNDVVGGQRTFTWQVIPLRAGAFAIPPLGVSTFDPNTGRRDTATSQPLSFTATGPTIVDEPEPTDAPDAEDDEPEEDDPIRFGPAYRHPEMRRAAPPFHARPWFVPVLLAAPLLAVIAWSMRFLGIGLEAFRARLSSRPSSKSHRRGAKRALSSGESVAFYASIASMLHCALGEALEERTLGMTHSAIRSALGQRADDELASRVVDELDAADFARFSAAGASADEMKKTLERTDALVARIASLPKAEAAR